MSIRQDPVTTVESHAHSVASSMQEKDMFAQRLGFELLEAGAGYARMRTRVGSEVLNAHQICHGGFIFSLADTAFALASNSYNITCVTAGGSIEFLQPARVGDTLLAEASEQIRGPRSGVYDVRITDEEGRIVALFRGKSVQLRSKVTAEEDTAVPMRISSQVE